MSLQFYALKADNGWYIPHPLGRNGRGGTHVELVDPTSGIAPRLFNNEASAKAALRWWLGGAVHVAYKVRDILDDEVTDENWHTEVKPERHHHNVQVVPVRIEGL
jgi:hypothetical protein